MSAFHQIHFFKIDIIFNVILIFITVLFFVFPAFAEEQSMWEKINDENNIQIFIKKIPGSPIIAVKGITVFDANIQKIASIVKNNSRFKEWVPRLLKVNTINESSQYEWVEYILLDSPWPLNDRDFVLRKTMEIDNERKRINFNFHSVKSTLKPESNKYIRAEISEGSFLLTSINKNKTRIVVITHADLKGMIPNWIINYIQKIWPLLTLKGLKEQAIKNDITNISLY
jgi:hypothetical protein